MSILIAIINSIFSSLTQKGSEMTYELYSKKKGKTGASKNTVTDGKKSVGKDDLSSDWLAKQLKEEAVSKRKVSEMFELKYEHSKSCEAEFIRRFHASQCDSGGVDRAAGK